MQAVFSELKLPFLCQDLNYDVVESLRLSLISEYDAEFSDETNTSVSSDSTSNDLESIASF